MPKIALTKQAKPATATIDAVRMSFLQWLAEDEENRADRYKAYREYYDGDHDTQLTERQRKYLQIKIGEEFNDNYCPIVVDALAEKLSITGFDVIDAQKNIIQEWLTAIRLDALQKIVHLSAVRDGDAYLIVGWDSDLDRPTFEHELAFDGHEGVKIHYSKEHRGQVEVASKRWRAESGENAGYVRRLNLYFPNRIEKYVSDQRVFEGAWQPYMDESKGETSWPQWWTSTGAEGGEPLGVPVKHWKNKDQGYNYGQSELKDVVSLQNALNKSVIDLLAAADTTAFRIFWMLGDDPSGLQIAPGSWIWSARPPSGDDAAAMGYFPGEDLSPLIKLKDAFALEIARVTRTPISYFQITGQRPAEGTLKQEETGLIAKAEDRQVTFGNAWEDALGMARKLYNVYGSGGMNEDEPIETMWADPVTRNEKELLETLRMKKELGVPIERIWLEMGYDDATIEKMKDSEDYQARLAMKQAAINLVGSEDG